MKAAHSIALFLAIILFSPSLAIAQNDSSSLNFIGVWQATPSIGSGWSVNYQFFDDGRFNFNHNQMDCADSVLTESGTYHYEEGILFLDFDSITYISGGEYIPATGSCGSEYELIGGITVTQFMEKSEALIVESTNPLEDYDYLDRILMDNQEWFRMLHDPNNY